MSRAGTTLGPLREIVGDVVGDDGLSLEVLDCGHVREAFLGDPRSRARFCSACSEVPGGRWR